MEPVHVPTPNVRFVGGAGGFMSVTFAVGFTITCLVSVTKRHRPIQHPSDRHLMHGYPCDCIRAEGLPMSLLVERVPMRLVVNRMISSNSNTIIWKSFSNYIVIITFNEFIYYFIIVLRYLILKILFLNFKKY